MANPIALKDDDQHLNLGGSLRSKQAIYDNTRILDHVMDVVVKDTVSMVLGIIYLQVISLLVHYRKIYDIANTGL
ncbi:hypothetical protein O0I10_002108 [Lichtheimia ornata]|uniref:Uncharacterized protein n=1 Tax=Lichtheimia ornata TaxID=688661 RepID=A0AAD7VB78_9FUNG|nr:uncharacterized protein O0I10_002108 [Lichtheimia ornata]KAJ8662414.1 hypothetical protein O0I10_002108 [Lichtheimia ornata]